MMDSLIQLFGVGLILEKDNKILLHLRDGQNGSIFPDHWCIFTGRVEATDWQGSLPDTLEFAVAREIGEELSVNHNGIKNPFVPESLHIHGKYDSDFCFGGKNYRQTSFVYRSVLHVPLDKLELNEGRKLILAGRLDVRDLNIPVNYKDAIFEYFLR